MLKMTAKSLYRVLRSHWLNSFILSWLFVILPADMAIIFLMKSFSVFYNMYRFSDIDTYCWLMQTLLGLCRLVGIGYRNRGIWVYTKRSRRLDCANRYIVRDIVVLSHDLYDLVSGWCVILSMDMGLFSIQCVLIVELINFFCRSSLFS